MTAGTITFTVQVGSGGFAIAGAVAEKLGFRYYTWEVTSQAAQMAGVSPEVVEAADHVPSFLERMMRRLSATPALSVEEAILEPAPTMIPSALQSLTSDDYREFIERVVREIASKGEAVVVGHAAQAILSDSPGVFKVMVLGSQRRRAERLAADQEIAVEQALARIKQTDRSRSELFKRIYHIDWLDSSVYDLCVNTDNVPTEIAVDAVVAAAKAMP